MIGKASICALLLTTGLAAQGQRTLFDDGWTFSQDGKTTQVNLPPVLKMNSGPNSGKGATGTG